MERMTHPRSSEKGRSYTWAAGVLDDIWGFDPAAFGLSPREAEQMDPQQRLLLELTWEALEDSGIRPSALAGSDTGVFVGASALDYGNLRINDAAGGDVYMMTGNSLSIISNRISYIFDWHGPSFTIDTACSSALVALNEAVVSLRSGRIDTAIVGGVNILASPFNFIGFSQAEMLSRAGLCQAFSASADGYVRSEGGVILVLKTREAAERNGDPVHCFITGCDINSDGRTNGISLPSKVYQARLLESVYLKNNIDPANLAFVEAHGTGTRVGDPIEAMAIGETLAKGRSEPLLIGSVKTNIGHMEAASGLGGVLKAMLALEHDQLPASLHSHVLNPDIDFDALNLKVPQQLTPLMKPRGNVRRIAGVNSFGFGGTNAHVVIADGLRPPAEPVAVAPSYLVLSAHSRAALNATVADYASRLDRSHDSEVAQIVAAAAFQRDRLPHRLVVPMASRSALTAILDELSEGDADVASAVHGTAVAREAPVAFVFAGNGSQFAGMGLAAYANSPSFREHLDLVSEEFEALAGWSIVDALRAPDLDRKLQKTQIAQPLLYAIQAATSQALVAKGLKPSFVTGHSVGEVAAAEAAGILDRASALKTIHARSLHQELTYGQGTMAVVIGSQETAELIVAKLPSLSIAAYNSSRSFTLSGPENDIAKLPALVRGLKARIRKLDLAYPFHSALMAPVEKPLLKSLFGLAPRPARVPFLSTVTGDHVAGPELDAHYWYKNVREPVQFRHAIELAYQMGARIFVEISPSASLLSHIKDCVDGRSETIAALCALSKIDTGVDPVSHAVAVALARGAQIDESVAFGPRPARRAVPLPHYPWQRKPYRIADSPESQGLTQSGPWHPLAGSRFVPDRNEWHATLDTALQPYLADHCVDGRIMLPGSAFAEMALAVARDWLGTAQAKISGLEISSPMILVPNSAREVMCRVIPAINQLEILSRPRLQQTAWQVHATAKVVRDPAPAIRPDFAGDTGLVPASRAVTSSEIYDLTARAGLQYGPAFRKLQSATRISATRVDFELMDEDALAGYGADPARLDACFHALLLVFSGIDQAVRGTAYIPVAFGEAILQRPGVAFTKGRIDVLRHDERVIIANFSLTDRMGNPVLFLGAARFQAIRTSHGATAGEPVIRQRLILAAEPVAARNDPPIAVSDLRHEADLASPSREAMSPEFILLEGWATAVALDLMRKLSSAGFLDIEALTRAGRVPAQAKLWLNNILVALDHSGLSHAAGSGREIDLETQLPGPGQMLQKIVTGRQDLSAEILIASNVNAAVDALVAGDLKNFLKPLSAKAIDTWELAGSQPRAAAKRLASVLEKTAAGWPKDRAMRILQIGYGALTGAAVALSAKTGAHLTVYDPDRRRLNRARMAFASAGSIVFTGDMAELPAGHFDVVVAAHVIHRFWTDRAFWPALRRAMAEGGVFAAVEPVPSLFHDLVLGLHSITRDEGAPVGPGAPPAFDFDWLDTLKAFSFGSPDVRSAGTEAGGALLLTAQIEAERRHWTGTGNILLIGDSDAKGAATISAFATLLASSGFHVSIMLDGEQPDENLTQLPETIFFFAGLADAHFSPVKCLLHQSMQIKNLAGRIGAKQTDLWIVTSGALDPVTNNAAGARASGLWAFCRTLANEIPTLHVRCVDLTDGLQSGRIAERLRDLMFAKTPETEILLGQTETRLVRFELAAPRDLARTRRADAARLCRGEGSGIDRIAWEPVSRREPEAGEVEIEVKAIGLNFRDVMFGLGLLPEEILENGFSGPTLGLECAGQVLRVGSAVKRLKPGDRVIAFARNAFATHVTTPAPLAAVIPNDLSFDMAATLPVAFMTAYYGLILCARLRPGEWVLVHGGAGGVGLAAIQIARWRGARVIATAGSIEKRALLGSLGAEHVFDSRSGEFVQDVRRVTGSGVDVVLNSLSGEAMERSIGVLQPFGRFVELGKRDYVANTHIGLRPFSRNLSYFGVDLDQLLIDQPATSRLLMRSVLGLFASRHLLPLPYRVFPARETTEAFRTMQQSGHIGKLVVTPPLPGDVETRVSGHFVVSPDRLHLITGGFGGFGLETARWLAEQGAKHILLIGRKGAESEAAKDMLQHLAARGVMVHSAVLDISDKSAVTRLFARFGADLPRLAGVIHAAMVLSDATIANLTADRFENVLRPKVAGADLLDQCTRSLKLDYFILYSSATTIVGNPGQAAYVAANGYLEGVARRRRAAGLPALAISWGAIKDAGILAQPGALSESLSTRLGMTGMLAQDALDLMGQALGALDSQGDPVLGIATVNWSAAGQYLGILKAPAYGQLMAKGDSATSDQAKFDIAALVEKHSPEDAREILGNLIAEEIARVLRLPIEDIVKSKPLAELGLDSLMGAELALAFDERFILKAPLTMTASGFTVNELADQLIGLTSGAVTNDDVATVSLIERHLGSVSDPKIIKAAAEILESQVKNGAEK